MRLQRHEKAAPPPSKRGVGRFVVDGGQSRPMMGVVLAEKARAEALEAPRPELPPTELTREQSRKEACP